MAKKRKQYVAHISKARSARAAMKDLAVGFCANNDHLHLINTKHKRFERAGASINNALEKIRYKWVVYIAVMTRNKDGQQDLHLADASPDFECFKEQINNSVTAGHKKFISEVKAEYPDMVCNIGWLALPVYQDVSEAELEEYFDMMGCWELLAPWQGELLGEDV